MRFIVVITEASVTQRILEWLALPPRAPPLTLAEALDPGRETIDRSFEEMLVEERADPGRDFDPSADDLPIEDEGARSTQPEPGTRRRLAGG